MSRAEQYRADAAQGLTLLEIARKHGVSPQSVRWVERRYGLSLKRDRAPIPKIEAKLTEKELRDFRLLRASKFAAKEALLTIKRPDLAEGLK